MAPQLVMTSPCALSLGPHQLPLGDLGWAQWPWVGSQHRRPICLWPSIWQRTTDIIMSSLWHYISPRLSTNPSVHIISKIWKVPELKPEEWGWAAWENTWERWDDALDGTEDGIFWEIWALVTLSGKVIQETITLKVSGIYFPIYVTYIFFLCISKCDIC